MGLRTPPSRTAPTAMKTNVHAAQEVKNTFDQRVETRRRPSHRKGPMEMARLTQPRMTIACRWGTGVATA